MKHSSEQTQQWLAGLKTKSDIKLTTYRNKEYIDLRKKK